LILNTDHIVFQIIPSEQNFDFDCRSEEFADQGQSVAIGPADQCFVAGITSPWKSCIFDQGRISIRNIIWMKIVDKCLSSLRAIEDIGEWASKTIYEFLNQEKGSSILSLSFTDFGELKQLPPSGRRRDLSRRGGAQVDEFPTGTSEEARRIPSQLDYG
jgi:hypothetical protein